MHNASHRPTGPHTTQIEQDNHQGYFEHVHIMSLATLVIVVGCGHPSVIIMGVHTAVEGHDRRTQQTYPQGAEEVCDTSSGACISARKKSISMDHNNNSTRDGELCDAHTKQTPSHNSN